MVCIFKAGNNNFGIRYKRKNTGLNGRNRRYSA